jgi:hypothetical protein
MSSATPGTSIKYTRDGSDPKTSPTATVYSSPFYFNGTIKAYSYVGTSLSAVVSATFNITGTLTAGKVPKTGQTTSYYAGDDGDLQRGEVWPTPWLNDNGNGTITDNLTGLMWERVPSTTSYIWNDVFTRIAALNSSALGGHTDWRLPNINELRCLGNFQDNGITWLNTQGFSNVQTSAYWSGTTASHQSDRGYSLYFVGPFSSPHGKDSGYYVIAVRGGQYGL